MFKRILSLKVIAYMLELRNICWKEFIYNAIFSFRIDSLEKEINSLKEELTSEEVMNNYKKYNEITDSIDEKEMELMEIMEKWEQLQS